MPDPIDSEWGPTPNEVGPFASAAPSEPYSTSGTVDTLGFDTTAVPSTGDVWYDAVGGNESLVGAVLPATRPKRHHDGDVHGQSGTRGTTMSGTLYVETFGYNSLTTGIGDWSSDILAALPYSYTLH